MRSRLVVHKDGTKEWVRLEAEPKIKEVNNIHGEDLTVDGYIDKYGGIKSTVDDSVYTSKRSYMEHLKRENLVIKDW